jgi:two-component sensor histidine kinase
MTNFTRHNSSSYPDFFKADWWQRIINAGLKPQFDYTFRHKLRSRNILSVLCLFFSMAYVFYFAISFQFIPLVAILTGMTLFFLSILYNYLERYNTSSLFLLISTNFCVLFFSLYLGYDSGIHLYLFTSPLIVLSLFELKNTLTLVVSVSSYLITLGITLFAGKYLDYKVYELEKESANILYAMNVVFCLLIIAGLTINLFRSNRNVYHLLILNNRELELNQTALENEISIRRRAEEKAKINLAQKEVLLAEIHHRVKNNLAVISGMMELQSFFITDKQLLGVIKESKNRIKAMALLYEKLYESKTLEKVNVSSYVDELIRFTRQSFSSTAKNIKVNSQVVGNADLEVREATPFALLLNELVSNSYKHAFVGKEQGNISITFVNYNNEYLLNYRDDGIGYAAPPPEEMTTLGLNLIDSFSKQLNGSYEFKNEKGTNFQLRFPSN